MSKHTRTLKHLATYLAGGLVERLKAVGKVRVQQTARDAQAPGGKLALARLNVELANGELLVPSDEGLLSQARGGLSFSLRGLSVSASWLIVGVLFVLPWALLIWAAVWVVRRLRGRGTSAPGV